MISLIPSLLGVSGGGEPGDVNKQRRRRALQGHRAPWQPTWAATSPHIFLITTNEYHFWFKKEEKMVLCGQDSSLRFLVIAIPGSNGEDTESLMLSHTTELFIEKPGL